MAFWGWWAGLENAGVSGLVNPDCQSSAARRLGPSAKTGIQPAHGWSGSQGAGTPLVRVQRRTAFGQGFQKGGTPFVSRVRGGKPLPGGHARNKAGGGQGGGMASESPCLRGYVAKRCITALLAIFSLRPLASPSRLQHARPSLAFGSRTVADNACKVAVRANLSETQPTVSDILFVVERSGDW